MYLQQATTLPYSKKFRVEINIKYSKQESIPVRCVPSTCQRVLVPTTKCQYHGGGYARSHVQGVSGNSPAGTMSLGVGRMSGGVVPINRPTKCHKKYPSKIKFFKSRDSKYQLKFLVYVDINVKLLFSLGTFMPIQIYIASTENYFI